MKKILISLSAILFGCGVVAAQTSAYSDLIISEYVEGSSNNKAIEIYNGTGADVSLSAYSLKKQTNGEEDYKNEYKFEDVTLSDGKTYVIASTQASEELKALADVQNGTITSFNGNDAIALFKEGTKIDEVGVFNSVDMWGENVTLRRLCGEGPTATYDPSEWETCEIDDFSGLGSHCLNDQEAPVINKVITSPSAMKEIQVYFDEMLDSASACLPSNYYLVDQTVTIESVELFTNSKGVTLTASAELVPETEYTLNVNGVKDLSGNATADLKYSFIFAYTGVENLAALNALRTTYVEGLKYKVSGDVVITAIIGKFGSNKDVTNVWVQDKDCSTTKGNSMMLYYMNDALPEGAKVGDVMTGLVGELTVYSDLIEMQYIDTSMLELSGENVEPVATTVTISELKAGGFDWQNALVKIENVSFDKTESTVLEENTSYTVGDDLAGIVLRTNREGSYLGLPIPEGTFDLVGYVGWYNGEPQISPRTKQDLGIDVANCEAVRLNYSVYPNPSNGVVNIAMGETGLYSVRVYTVSGMEVMRADKLSGESQLDLSKLAKGLYMLEIRHENGVSVSKVVLK